MVHGRGGKGREGRFDGYSSLASFIEFMTLESLRWRSSEYVMLKRLWLGGIGWYDGVWLSLEPRGKILLHVFCR